MRKRIGTISNAAGWLVAALPLLIVALFYLYAIRVRALVGYWPSYGHPESWSIGFPVHYAILRPWVYGFFLGGIWVQIFLVSLYGVVPWYLNRRCPKLFFITVGAGFLIMIALWKIDPGKFVDWFMD